MSLTQIKSSSQLTNTFFGFCFFLLIQNLTCKGQVVLPLSGEWEFGFDRNYTGKTMVPGLALNPAISENKSLWLKKSHVKLPAGSWTSATLVLKGARFCPKIFINGVLCDSAPGGMAPIQFLLKHPEFKPGNTIQLEVKLAGLEEVPEKDASKIPEADKWRSNVSSCLWDKPYFKFSNTAQITSVVPFTFFDADSLALKIGTSPLPLNSSLSFKIKIKDKSGKDLISKKIPIVDSSPFFGIKLQKKLLSWSPEKPELYSLEVLLFKQNLLCDSFSMNYGFRDFKVKGLGFELNSKPFKARAGTLVWHRWIRDKEGQELGFDSVWIAKNIAQRLKKHGANMLRFHLGSPPEQLLDMCDKIGLAVQLEWPFFHGMKGSKESLIKQWNDWLILASRHPSVFLIHPWNETEGEELKTAWSALDAILPNFPPLVLAERDVIHVHKYWWSLFENLGLYYDSISQFPKPLMVDEFGGNYLDGNNNPGGYKTLAESNLRFLGRNATSKDRAELHSLSNSKVAEYWRRLGVAGFSPFCIAGSWEDGNHWFLGPIKNGKPKPVWDALTAAYSPISISLDIWNKHFLHGDQVTIPVHFFNDLDTTVEIKAEIRVVSVDGKIGFTQPISQTLSPFDHQIRFSTLTLPEQEGDYELVGILFNKVPGVSGRIASYWKIKCIKPGISKAFTDKSIQIDENETEIRNYLAELGIKTKAIGKGKTEWMIFSGASSKKIGMDAQLQKKVEKHINQGGNLLILNAGPQWLGSGYETQQDLSTLQSGPKIISPKKDSIELPLGIKIHFQQVPEPESHLHFFNQELAKTFSRDPKTLRIWNGLKGGLIAPAAEMTSQSLTKHGLLNFWFQKGADTNLLKNKDLYAYELQGYFDFSPNPNDKIVKDALRKKVRFLVDDAPALANSINVNAPVKEINLSHLYQHANGGAAKINPLIVCGKNLSRDAVLEIETGIGKGKIIASQLLMQGRLDKNKKPGLNYKIGYDPIATEMLLWLLSR